MCYPNNGPASHTRAAGCAVPGPRYVLFISSYSEMRLKYYLATSALRNWFAALSKDQKGAMFGKLNTNRTRNRGFLIFFFSPPISISLFSGSLCFAGQEGTGQSRCIKAIGKVFWGSEFVARDIDMRKYTHSDHFVQFWHKLEVHFSPSSSPLFMFLLLCFRIIGLIGSSRCQHNHIQPSPTCTQVLSGCRGGADYFPQNRPHYHKVCFLSLMFRLSINLILGGWYLSGPLLR